MSEHPEGWTFTDSGEMDWQERGPGVAMKTLGVADGRMQAMFKFDAGYVGGTHGHTDAEFTYILEGEVISNGVLMAAGHSYAAQAGTTHSEFRTDSGCTLVSVFPVPSG
jgi:anti-sigma factor ChrR (cupin superfamily)